MPEAYFDHAAAAPLPPEAREARVSRSVLETERPALRPGEVYSKSDILLTRSSDADAASRAALMVLKATTRIVPSNTSMVKIAIRASWVSRQDQPKTF